MPRACRTARVLEPGENGLLEQRVEKLNAEIARPCAAGTPGIED